MAPLVTISPGYSVPPVTLPRGCHVRSSNQSQKLVKPFATRYFVARKLNQGSTREGQSVQLEIRQYFEG